MDSLVHCVGKRIEPARMLIDYRRLGQAQWLLDGQAGRNNRPLGQFAIVDLHVGWKLTRSQVLFILGA